MQHITGWVENGNTKVSVSGLLSTTLVQKSFPLATVTVYVSGTVTPALIYSDNVGTALGNPFTANSNGTWGFYAQPGLYDVVFSGTGVSPSFTIDGLGNSISTFLGPSYVSAADYPGNDMGQQIQAAIAALPVTGGTVDCRGFSGSQLVSGLVTSTVPLVLIFGDCTVTSTTPVAFSFTASCQIQGAGRTATTFQQSGVSGDIFHFATVEACSVQDIQISSASHQTSGAGITITGNGALANQASLIQDCIFSGQWIAIDSGECLSADFTKNKFQDIRFRGIRMNNTVSGDEGNNSIIDNSFSSDVTLTGNSAIELIAGGGLLISLNQFQTFDVTIAVNWNTAATSSQLVISNNLFEASKNGTIKLSRVAGFFAAVLIEGNFMAGDVFSGTLIWFAMANGFWTSDAKIIGNQMNLGTSTIGILLEGNGNGDQAMIDGNQMYSAGAGTVGLRIGTGYTQVYLGINDFSANTPTDISSGLRGIYLPDKLGAGIPQGLVLTQQVVIPNNQFYSARDSTGTQQKGLLGIIPNPNPLLADILVVGQDQNATATMAGPMRFAVGLDAHAAQFNNARRYTPSFTGGAAPVAVPGAASAEQVFTVTGITANDTIIVQAPNGMPAGLGIGGWRCGTNQVAITFMNASAGPLTPVAGDYQILAFTAFAV